MVRQIVPVSPIRHAGVGGPVLLALSLVRTKHEEAYVDTTTCGLIHV